MRAALVASLNLATDAYSIDCALLALLSLLAAWKPTGAAKLFFVGKDRVPLWAGKTLRVVALVGASGAILAIVLRVVQKGR